MKRQQPEAALQKSVAVWLRLQYPKLLWWHVPNGGDLPVQRKRALADMGVRPGVPDIAMVLDDGRAAFIELKSGRGRVSFEQQAFADAATVRGALWHVCWSLDEVRDIMRVWTRQG